MDVAGITLDARYQPLLDQSDEVSGVVGIAHDITERRHLEEQLLQSQKMEAIGQLAGGISHDFNNLLSTMMGYAQLALAKLSEDDPISTYLAGILKASERAADLTRQLLAFSRRQITEPRSHKP